MDIENLREYLDKKEIETVAFDVDNTLMATDNYYIEHTREAVFLLAEKIDKNRDPIDIAKEFEVILFEEFERNGKKPTVINDEFINALEIYLGKKDESLEGLIGNYFKDFYKTVPTIHESIKDILERIIKTNRKIVLHSHAQKEWTAMKAQKLSELVGIDIPYLATPIDEEKDVKNWLKAFSLVNANPKNTLVVGDNLMSDIVPSIEAGSKNVVFIRRNNENIPEVYVNGKDINFLIISDISELLDTLK